MTVTNQERQDLIRSETLIQGLCHDMINFTKEYMHDIDVYLEVIKSIPIQKIDFDFVWNLLRMYCNFEEVREKTAMILIIYLNRIYEHLLFDEPKAQYTDDLEEININEYLKIHVFYPLLLASQGEINREKYPITDHRLIFRYFVYAMFNAFIPCEYMDVADLIGAHYDLRKPDHGLQEIYDSITQWNFENSFAATQYVSMFESKLNDIFNNFYTITEFITELMNETDRKYGSNTNFGDKRREITKRFSNAFPEMQSKNLDDLIFNIFNDWNMVYIKEEGNKDNQHLVTGDIFNTTGIIIQRLLDEFCPEYLTNKKLNQIIRLLFEEVTRYFDNVYGYTLPFKEIIDKIMAGDTSYRGKTNDSVYDTATEATEDTPPVNDPNIRKPKVDGSKKMESAQAQIYHAYKNYKNAEQKIDSQISKMLQACKRLAIGDTRTEIIEGKKFSAIGLLKKALSTAAIFAFGPIKGIILLVVRYALKKKTTTAERRKILTELQVELEMINEKINDAKGDGNRQAKYAMMRTKAEIEAAIGQIKYGLEVDQRNMEGAKNALNNAIGVNKRRGF